MFYTLDANGSTKCTIDDSSILSNTNYIGFEDANNQYNGFSISLPQDMQPNIVNIQDQMQLNQWENLGRTIEFPFNLSPSFDALRTSVTWDSPPCTSEMSTTFVTSKCYT